MCDGRGTSKPPSNEADQLSLYRRNLVDLVAENTRLREEVALLRAIASSVIAESMHSAGS